MAGIVSGLDSRGVSSLRPVTGTAEEILGLLREWDAADDPEPLVIATSGLDRRPKRVVLSRDAMRASALATQERLGGPGQWVLNLPPTYVAGVQVLYRSRGGRHRAGDHRRRRARGRSRRAQLRLAWCRPSWSGCSRRPAATSRRWPRFDAVLVGGGPLDADGARRGRAARHPGRADLRHERDLRRLRLRRRPLAGVEVRIGDDGRGAAARADAVRRLRGRARADRGGAAATAGSAPTTSAGSTTTGGCGSPAAPTT